jgi:hypothetical protein
MNNPNELTIENSVLVLIDHQPAVAINVHSIDLGLLVNNVSGLAAKYGGGGTNFLTDYALDQITAGVVSPPSFISAAHTKQVAG